MTKPRQIVIIGCGAGGGTTAQFARKADRSASVIVFEKGSYTQYSKCGLPYAIAGIVPNFEDLIEFSEEWFAKEHIDVRLNTPVDAINLKEGTISATNGSKRIEESFDSLILATGAKPGTPPIQNIVKNGNLLNGVHVLRTINDGKQIQSHITQGKKAVIIGAGLIGLEMADALYQKGMKVTVIEALPSILPNTLDEDMSEPVKQALQDKITIHTNHLATRAEDHHGTITSLIIKDATTGDEQKIESNLLVIATGTKPETTLAKNIGCRIGKTGGISVNEKAETSVKNVYAVGDCTEYRDFVTNDPITIGLGSIVVRQGITAGINAVGGSSTLLPGVLLSRTSEFFGIEIAAVGPVKQSLHRFPVMTGKYTGCSKSDYFPGREPITIKVNVDEQTHLLLSAQAVGSNAAQRINTLACAILGKISVEELRKLETTYAPPIAPTLDAITLVCDVAAMRLERKRRQP